MTWKVVSIVLCLAWISFTAGCSSIMEERRGGGGGPVVTGALIGALLGGVVGQFAYDQQRTREQTAQTYKYQPSQGPVLTIENVYVSPPTVRPGDVVDLKMTYAVLHPSPNVMTRIREIREISFRGELAGRPEVNVEQSDGTYTTTVPLRLPATAVRGTYRVKSMVESPNGRDTRETTFTVQ